MEQYSFQEVMRQWARMCNSVPGKYEHLNLCSDKESGYICPMKDCALCNKPLSSQTDDDRLIGERIIMSWAAEHPVVYPTWREYLMDLILPNSPSGNFATFLLEQYIPADIAQKLGIEPKEV